MATRPSPSRPPWGSLTASRARSSFASSSPAPGCQGDPALAAELCDRVAGALGKSFTPEAVRFVAELPKTRSGKILRRVIQRVATGQEPGDLSTIENLAAIEAVRRAE